MFHDEGNCKCDYEIEGQQCVYELQREKETMG